MGIGGEVVARLKALVEVDTKDLKKGLAEANAEMDKSKGRLGGVNKAASTVAKVGFVALAGAAFEGVKGAAALQTKMAVLGKQLRNAHVDAQDAADAQKYLEDQSNATGFAIGDLADAFGKSVTALGSYKKAQRETALAENIARGTGESLAMANKQAIKVFEGKSTALSKLGVVLPKVTTAEDVAAARLKVHNAVVEKSWKQYHLSTAALANAKASLAQYDKTQMASAKATDLRRTATADADYATKKYQGSTKAYAETLAGKLQLTENRVKNLLDQLGAKLLPVITSLFGFLASHTNVLIGVGAAIAAVWAASVAWTAAMKVQALWTKIVAAGTAEAEGAQWSLNTALMANPVALVVVALAALALALVVAYKKSSTFRDIVNGVFRDVKHVATPIVHDIVNVVTSIFHVFRDVANLLGDLIHGRWGAVWGDAKRLATDAIHALVEYVTSGGLLQQMLSSAQKLGGKLWSGVKSAISGFAGWLLRTVEGAFTTKNLGRMATAAAAAGLALLNGIKNGLGDLGSWIYDQVRNAIESAVGLGGGSNGTVNHRPGGRGGAGAAGGRGAPHPRAAGASVTVVQHISQTNPDPAATMRAARSAALAAFG